MDGRKRRAVRSCLRFRIHECEDSQSCDCRQLIGRISLFGKRRKIPPTHTEDGNGGKKTENIMENPRKKDEAEGIKNGQLGRWRNVKNYIICAEKCAYIFPIRKADQVESFVRIPTLLSIYFLFYAKLLRFTIHCIFNLVGFSLGYGFELSFSGSLQDINEQRHKGVQIANSKGPRHINKDFISFICYILLFVSFFFFVFL